VPVRWRRDERRAALPLPPGRRKPPTPGHIAKVVTTKLKSLPGELDKAEATVRLVLPRPVLERLYTRGIDPGRAPEHGGVLTIAGARARVRLDNERHVPGVAGSHFPLPICPSRRPLVVVDNLRSLANPSKIEGSYKPWSDGIVVALANYASRQTTFLRYAACSSQFVRRPQGENRTRWRAGRGDTTRRDAMTYAEPARGALAQKGTR
jgi:hypothetical protein